MKGESEKRTAALEKYNVEAGATVRQAAAIPFGIQKRQPLLSGCPC